MKTRDVKGLALEALASISEPYSPDVIDDVFFQIQSDPKWLNIYESLCADLGKDVVNQWVAKWVSVDVGKVGKVVVPSKRNSLTSMYSVLDDAKIRRARLSEAEARDSLWEYWRARRDSLPSSVDTHQKETLVALIRAGVSPEEAFRLVLGPDLPEI